jgi:hypothetical protein
MTTSVGTALWACVRDAADVVIVRRSVVNGQRFVKTNAFCTRPTNRLHWPAMTRAATAPTITSITANAVIVVAARKRAR